MALFARLSVIVLLSCLTGFWWASRVAVGIGAEVGIAAGFAVRDLRSLSSSDTGDADDADEGEVVRLRGGEQDLRGDFVAGAMRAKTVRGRARSSEAPPTKLEATFVVSSAKVLAIANAGRRPSGYPVRAKGNRPSGIALSATNGLGLPVQDGDVLTHVAGQHVRTAGDVVGLVLALRGRQVPAIFGIFWRGGKPYGVSVEQPYLQRD
ncbi:MAG: hypothetical protein SFV15_09960 [Polyangiaceae bacterium]|nr:hypothetical protein [Polyangiaceae bacterium]